mmetsp:Transcript_5529/g.8586  ORF Transcript_5529/g.8586 Transcript_5529/m.8586 type:complete len:577 (+) Transcript_5529:178-1908(+)|eukprot:CAMPEP_0184663916 /NCGR_PEP_ID=MMETSP0308-20130426/50463_1 /TAXON_ID=38269 /ORGANISM="Gloeochaete witrockiana, Strain SAG 46.84" /LENGTH=576 /DNA_ID=CAMNT_0027106987 /DNA_START=115 /DNA_END=1845 /DNA_ORIENTATION=+
MSQAFQRNKGVVLFPGLQAPKARPSAFISILAKVCCSDWKDFQQDDPEHAPTSKRDTMEVHTRNTSSTVSIFSPLPLSLNATFRENDVTTIAAHPASASFMPLAAAALPGPVSCTTMEDVQHSDMSDPNMPSSAEHFDSLPVLQSDAGPAEVVVEVQNAAKRCNVTEKERDFVSLLSRKLQHLAAQQELMEKVAPDTKPSLPVNMPRTHDHQEATSRSIQDSVSAFVPHQVHPVRPVSLQKAISQAEAKPQFSTNANDQNIDTGFEEDASITNEEQYYYNLQAAVPSSLRLNDFLMYLEGRLYQYMFTKENSVIALITCNEPSLSGVCEDMRMLWKDPKRTSSSCMRISAPAGLISVSPDVIAKQLSVFNCKKMIFLHLTHVAIGHEGELGTCAEPGSTMAFEGCRVLDFVKRSQHENVANLLAPARNPPITSLDLKALKKRLAPHFQTPNGMEANLAEMAFSTCRAYCQQLAKDLPVALRGQDLEFSIVGGVLIHGPWGEYVNTVAFTHGRSLANTNATQDRFFKEVNVTSNLSKKSDLGYRDGSFAKTAANDVTSTAFLSSSIMRKEARKAAGA